MRTVPKILVFVVFLAGSSAVADPAVVSVADFAGRESFTAGIQEAIDALPAEGGVVDIPPGTYVLRRSVALRPQVTLRGAGSTTVLTRGREAVTKLKEPAKKGDTAIAVESVEGFRVGDECFLRDNQLGGWHSVHGLVNGIEPGRIILAEPLWTCHEVGVFQPKQHARLTNYFPLIRGNRFHWDQPLKEVSVVDLVLDGNLTQDTPQVTDFTIAAIHFANVHDGLVRNVTVRGSVGDGIGIQRGQDVRVIDCLTEHCRVHGFHPGTSLRGAVFANNIGRHNGGDGLYFCADVVGIAVTSNLFHDNAWNGIGGLGDQPGGDRFNVVSNNVCRANGQHGIYANGGGGNLITGNVCLDNSQAKQGAYSGIALQNATRCTITGNHCVCDGEKPTQKYGVEEIGTADENTIVGNQCFGNLQGEIRVLGQDTQVMANGGKVDR